METASRGGTPAALPTADGPEGQRGGDAQTEGTWRMALLLPLRGTGLGPRAVYLVKGFLLGPLFDVWQ